MSAIGDIIRAREYEKKVDMLLFDAKAPITMDDALPGGNGLSFDWKLISGHQWHVPWMLSGGLDVKNVNEAIKISGAKIVDISSGLETTPGNKDINKIRTFMEALQETNDE
ncbi:MAG: phosphoribosylanthranilate isomerase [Emcibacteraceae bacterium]|nr:phosphoribosylanthranilate isomerase [Emcibacteraceae bacterium]